MFELELMSGKKFQISKEEANSLIGKSGLVPITSLGGMINISSISSILPVEVVTARKIASDGQRCYRKFGQWYNENTNVLVSPELQKELDDRKKLTKELPSKFAKELWKIKNHIKK